MDKSWIYKPRLSEAYKDGVDAFLEFGFGNIQVEKLKCPCNRCCLYTPRTRLDMRDDLICYGFMKSYTNWVLHGEEIELPENTNQFGGEIHTDQIERDDSMTHLLNDLFPNITNQSTDGEVPPIDVDEHVNNNSDEPSTANLGSKFDDMLGEYCEELYPGCTKFTRLSFILKLYHIKCLCGISDKGISMVVELIKEVFPEAKLPDTFRDMKKVIRNLGLSYKSIDVCPNHCMLYWEENASKEKCDVCQLPRWKESTIASKKGPTGCEVPDGGELNDGEEQPGVSQLPDGGEVSECSAANSQKKEKKKRKIPAMILRYFPLKPRLQRLFMSSKTASDMTWHSTAANTDGKLRHPKDGKAWKAFDSRYPEFASEPRNVRLGLASDGFNPFGSMSLSYSIWPVILFTYNLPPWIAMNRTSMIMSMIIPGKKSPGNDIDVFLQPLIKELKELWSDGVNTLDASKKKSFTMRAAVMWTVNDFPAFGNLSGWNTYTSLACPSCNYDSVEHRLRFGGKNCFMGHRRYLPLGLLPIDYTDWRLYPKHRKEDAWKLIQTKFSFDDPERRKKYAISVLGSRCKDFKVRLWKTCKRSSRNETLANRPSTIPYDQWQKFVTDRYGEKWKKLQAQNIQNQKKNVLPHACGRKSFARKRKEIFKETGNDFSRGEFFIHSRKRQNGNFVNEEAKKRADKLTELITQNGSGNSGARLDDEFATVFGPERSGRIRCLGRGPTPSKWQKRASTQLAIQEPDNTVVDQLRSHVTGLTSQVEFLSGFVQHILRGTTVQPNAHMTNFGTLGHSLSTSLPNFGALGAGSSTTLPNLGALASGSSTTLANLGALGSGSSTTLANLGALGSASSPTMANLGALVPASSTTLANLGALGSGLSMLPNFTTMLSTMGTQAYNPVPEDGQNGANHDGSLHD